MHVEISHHANESSLAELSDVYLELSPEVFIEFPASATDGSEVCDADE
jgi:hypothetical protein